MKKLYCAVCTKYRKFKNPRTSYIFEKILVFSNICSKCKYKDQKIFEKEKSVEILKIYNYLKNRVEENKIKEFRLKI